MTQCRLQRMIPTLIVALGVLSFGGVSVLRTPAHAAGDPVAARVATSPTFAPTPDNDGDDDAKYHWGDPAHAREELIQMRGAAVFLMVVAASRFLRDKRLKERARP